MSEFDDARLDEIAEHLISSSGACRAVMIKAHKAWDHDMGKWVEEDTEEGVLCKLATGGWSHNEEVISALYANHVFWGMCWVKSERGGYYEFEVTF